MGTINRYTQSPRYTYEPRTLQELMMAPAYKRGKHDEMEASISEYETALAQFGAMDVHDARLKEEQDKLNANMQGQRDKLDREGFSPSSKSDFLRFNKEFQQAIGPNGAIGRIQSAKESFDKGRQQILDVALKQGDDLQASQKQLENQRELYRKDFEETGQIKDFQAILPPSFHDLDADIKDMKAQLGHTIETELTKGEPYTLNVDTSTGSPLIVVTTHTGAKYTMSNSQAIKDAQESLKNKWLNPGGAGYKSAEWNGMSLDTINKAIESGLRVMSIKEEKDGREDKVNIISPSSSSSGSDDEFDGTRRLTASESASNAWAENGINTKGDVLEKVDALKTSESPADQANGKRLEERMKVIEQEYITNHPQMAMDYQAAEGQVQNAYNRMINATNGVFNLTHYKGDPRQTTQNYMITPNEKLLQYALEPGKLVMKKDETTGIVTIKRDGTAFEDGVLAKGGQEVEDYYNTLMHGAKIISAYDSGLNNKIQFEKQQDIKVNVTKFDKEADRTAYNNTMRDLITNQGKNSLKPRIAFSREDNIASVQKQLNVKEQANLLDMITNGNSENFNFKGIIAQTENGVPAIEVQYRVPGKGKEKDIIYTAQYELPKLGVIGTEITGINESILNTMRDFGGIEGEILMYKMKQSVRYKDLYPTFHEDDYSQADIIKQGVMPNLSKKTDLDRNIYNVSDALSSNNLILNKFDIATENFGNGEQKYSIKMKPINGDTKPRRLNWADLIPNKDLDKMPKNIKRYIKQAMIPFMRKNGIKRSQDITDEHEKMFMEELTNTDIYVNNYYDLLDILSGKLWVED